MLNCLKKGRKNLNRDHNPMILDRVGCWNNGEYGRLWKEDSTKQSKRTSEKDVRRDMPKHFVSKGNT